MPGEREWVESWCKPLTEALRRSAEDEWRVEVCVQERLPYTYEIFNYDGEGQPGDSRTTGYATDMLVYDIRDDQVWVPRIVVEWKVGVTTHDALTYSAKAATHKHVHPYLRYGVVIAGEPSIPGRLLRHGAYFDFMAVWADQAPTKRERASLVGLLAEEVRASRELQALLGDTRRRERKRYQVLHRPLQLTRYTK